MKYHKDLSWNNVFFYIKDTIVHGILRISVYASLEYSY